MNAKTTTGNTGRIFGSTATAFVVHLFGTLTCATCWVIFGPSIALVFGSAGVAALSTLRPLAPLALMLSAMGFGYSIYQLVKVRGDSKRLPFRVAAVFTVLSILGWIASAIYVTITVVRG